MKRLLSKLIFQLMGWKVIGASLLPNKCIIIGAPHTSNWDFFIGRCYGYITGIEAKYLIKSELFFPILGALLRYNGGIPVYRQEKHNLVSDIVDRFNNSSHFILGLSPEGTRKKVDRWKTGFYHIAYKARVPILFLKIDYKKKEIGIFNKLIPSGDYHKDIIFIQEQFADVQGKIPENYNPIIK